MDNAFIVGQYAIIICPLFAVIAGIYHYKLLDLPGKIFFVFTCLGAASELLGRYAAIRYHNNLPVYNIYQWLSFGLTALYFNYSVDSLHRYKFGWYIGTAGIALGILNCIYLQPLTMMNFHFYYLQGIVTIALSLFAFYRVFYLSSDLKLGRLRHFWIPLILCSFWTLTFFIWGIYGYVAANSQNWLDFIALSLNAIVAFFYFAIAYVFWRYPKLKAVDTQQSGKEVFYGTI